MLIRWYRVRTSILLYDVNINIMMIRRTNLHPTVWFCREIRPRSRRNIGPDGGIACRKKKVVRPKRYLLPMMCKIDPLNNGHVHGIWSCDDRLLRDMIKYTSKLGGRSYHHHRRIGRTKTLLTNRPRPTGIDYTSHSKNVKSTYVKSSASFWVVSLSP